MRPPQVFISYSHEKGPDGIPEHSARALELAQQLVERGLDAVIDQYYEHNPPYWPLWMIEEIATADFVLCLASPGYIRSFRAARPRPRRPGDPEPPPDPETDRRPGRGASWEGIEITKNLYAEIHRGGSSKFINVLLPGCTPDHIPTVLDPHGTTHYRIPDDGEELYRRLTNQPRPETVPRARGDIIRLDEQEFEQFSFGQASPARPD